MSAAEVSRAWRRKHPLYSVHEGMMQRCGQKNGCIYQSNLARYRDRGVRVCDEWTRFPAFEAWAIAHGWRKGLQIDRIDGDGDYSPSNCRFVTRIENARRRCNNRIVEVFGSPMPLVEAVEKFGDGLHYNCVMARLRRGWSIEEALVTPSDPRFQTRRR